MNLVVMLAILSSTFARPPLENITYLQNISLTYDGQGITNLDSINQMDGMDPGMANSLKKAILEVLPSYIAETQHTTVTLNDTQHEPNDGHSSDAHPSDMGAGPIAVAPAADMEQSTVISTVIQLQRRQMISDLDVANPLPQDHIDDQFWSRDDLVHFLVNIDTIATTSMPALDAITTEVPHSS
ncbi:hypothetical protein ANCCAN_21487 [Ancylostoma caninum]|uniref:Uncharacterized protein n=1 Tax=Ancylostoma caninum TaxID=29170 RepID=A0A368FME2_ANCCA|nr:hypothetical protein ANCCAN_21487 [Ancylostoma caninum]